MTRGAGTGIGTGIGTSTPTGTLTPPALRCDEQNSSYLFKPSVDSAISHATDRPRGSDVDAGNNRFYLSGAPNNGGPANGNYDLQFKLFDRPSGGIQRGSTVTLINASVASGIFTVQIDFGSVVFISDGTRFSGDRGSTGRNRCSVHGPRASSAAYAHPINGKLLKTTVIEYRQITYSLASVALKLPDYRRVLGCVEADELFQVGVALVLHFGVDADP